VKFSQIELALSSGAADEVEAAIKRAYVAGRLRNTNLVIGQTALEDLLVVMLASVISLRADAAEVNAATVRCRERLSALLELGRIAGLDVARPNIGQDRGADPAEPDVANFSRARTAFTPPGIDSSVGRRLRLLRLLANVTIDDLARYLKVDAPEVARYEAGKVRLQPTQIAELVDKLQVPLHWFFLGFEDDALEVCLAQEIELALQHRTDRDIPFLAQFTELFGTYRILGPTDDRTRVIAQARMLVAQRIAAEQR
jgi:transcriptional regulator with XRE-family HTH domain